MIYRFLDWLDFWWLSLQDKLWEMVKDIKEVNSFILWGGLLLCVWLTFYKDYNVDNSK